MQPMTTTDTRAAIRLVNDALEASFAGGNAAGIANLYTRDGEIFPTGRQPIRGTAGIQAFWQAALDAGIKQAKLTTRDLEEVGDDTAIEIGLYTMWGANGQQLDEGKLLVVWKKQHGTWKLQQDIWNSSLLVPA